MKRIIVTIVAMVLTTSAMATPDFWETFKKVYGVKAGSAFDKARCATCHTEVPEHNPFGADVKAALRSASLKVLTETTLRQVEKRDSDGDGWSNGDEIAAGYLPGDKSNHPQGAPPDMAPGGRGMSGMGAMTPEEHRSMFDQMVPKHSFHPVIVHFPVALFIFGALLDLIGFRSKRPGLRDAAYWNLLAGSASTAVAITSGFIVALRLGYSLLPGSAVFTHLTVAILASVAMLATVLWRRKGAHSSWGYFVLLILAAALVGLAGHFGGGMVYA